MRITQKGQVTIPQEAQSRLGFLPYSEVEFEIADHARGKVFLGLSVRRWLTRHAPSALLYWSAGCNRTACDPYARSGKVPYLFSYSRSSCACVVG
jgi:hypothetical protein